MHVQHSNILSTSSVSTGITSKTDDRKWPRFMIEHAPLLIICSYLLGFNGLVAGAGLDMDPYNWLVNWIFSPRMLFGILADFLISSCLLIICRWYHHFYCTFELMELTAKYYAAERILDFYCSLLRQSNMHWGDKLCMVGKGWGRGTYRRREKKRKKKRFRRGFRNVACCWKTVAEQCYVSTPLTRSRITRTPR